MLKPSYVLSLAGGLLGLAVAPLVAQATRSTDSEPAGQQRVTFLRDVAPILNKVGCTAGACHGAAKGKNGFKLSLRGSTTNRCSTIWRAAASTAPIQAEA